MSDLFGHGNARDRNPHPTFWLLVTLSKLSGRAVGWAVQTAKEPGGRVCSILQNPRAKSVVPNPVTDFAISCKIRDA